MAESARPAAPNLTEEARRLLQEIEREVPGAASLSADCRPPLDIMETTTSVEVMVDVPGVPATALRLLVRNDTLLVVGAKPASAVDPTARFHLAERSYGRFARVVRLSGAFDASRAQARVEAGQLCVTLPRIDDRRGRAFAIPIASA
jgi:HSP20 family protein